MKAQANYLKQKEIINNNGERQEFERAFASTSFDFELMPDAEFTCHMTGQFEGGSFTGYWMTSGDDIEMTQTHENGKEKRDKMVGKKVGGQLHMEHVTQGLEIPYVFERIE